MDTATFHVVPAAIADQIGGSTLWELACCTGLAFIGGPGSTGHTDKVYRAIPGEDPIYERTRLMHKIASPTPLRQDAIDFIVATLEGVEPIAETVTLATMTAYRRLADGLSDMVEGGRLTEADCPDDYQWMAEQLATLAGLDPGDTELPAHMNKEF